MSYTLDIEPQIVRDAEAYAERNGTTLEQFLRACVLVAAAQKDPPVARCSPHGGVLHPLRGEKPCIVDLIGYGARFHTPRSTEEWMKDLREGEQ